MVEKRRSAEQDIARVREADAGRRETGEPPSSFAGAARHRAKWLASKRSGV